MRHPTVLIANALRLVDPRKAPATFVCEDCGLEQTFDEATFVGACKRCGGRLMTKRWFTA